MAASIVLKEVSVYHPENAVNNQDYINHFNKQGSDITRLLDALGRENRYVADESENALTMAVEASKIVLEKAGMTGQDMDMIVFVSGTPEYLWPPNSAAVHHVIGGKKEAVVYDMNAACAGMIIAAEQVSRNMTANPHIQRALIVGSEVMHRFSRREEAVTYASFGDGASAIILEKNENSVSGFVDSIFSVNTESIEKIVFPACGISNMYDEQTSDFDKRVQWENVSNDRAFTSTLELIETLLKRNNLQAADVSAYCLSQLSRKNIYKIQEALNESIEKFPITGTEYGYTGAASPFMAFERSVSSGRIRRGDYVVFWSVGAGTASCALLFKY
ncbi:3-oxoacyl-[acyl-carrier-protein] synthase III C-terminal domain-containing protein [Bacillus sp. MUM 13]|uniref:3-oxoacyl-[acyl-carrier-protein] synthase III C-terminal domain-containing protein n=1 Tax=Bacillus sp. MUM 13 TaxID=1678001 RepID=UPI0008F5B975|nr:3-oxoacyl-[acyl-carrier-protein] synthase III C-terminal domain-containing protein [Bacillus sp. MUM 13]OIK09601.1 beta-ketoacyl-ACP synthase [Bacillus sp. MUM 13]